MRTFIETNGVKESGKSIIELTGEESNLIIIALEEYCNKNKRKKIAKNLLYQMENTLPIK